MEGTAAEIQGAPTFRKTLTKSVNDAAVNGFSGLRGLDDASLPQDAEMLGDIILRSVHTAADFPYVERFVEQLSDDRPAGRIGKRLQHSDAEF